MNKYLQLANFFFHFLLFFVIFDRDFKHFSIVTFVDTS